MGQLNKFKVGDKVIYKGLVGIVVSFEFHLGFYSYFLHAEIDEKLTCRAQEHEIEIYTPEDEEELDQEKTVRNAKLATKIILDMVDSLTDKYYIHDN